MASVLFVNGHWFAYMPNRVLGPFRFERQAWRAVHDEERSDDFWGWGPNRDGQNMLGRLWMEVRAELRGS